MNVEPAPLKIERLHVHLAQKEVLKDLSVEVAKGEVFGLLGSNGAGKTTLIRTICGRVKASAGSISIAGHQGKAALRHIGLVPQELALYSHLTARENLTVFGRLSGLSARDAISAVEWASEAADIKQHLNDRVEILSGGWKRRVNIAAAILHRPALLVLDEPTVGVDIDARNGLHEVIGSLSRAGIGVVLATHDLEQAHSICSRVGFLHRGRIALEGAPHRLLADIFHSRKEIVLDFRQSAADQQQMRLRAMGFSSPDGGHTWTRLDFDGPLEAVRSSLQEAGINPRELRLREPGLDTLFVRVVRDQELAG